MGEPLDIPADHRGAEAADSCEFVLDASLEIADVTEARRRLLDALVGIRRLSLDVRPLTSVDTAGVQLLLALMRETQRRGIDFTCRGESPPLALALRALGLDGALEGAAR
jgi:anti-anti-sigma regulatory factor